VAATTVLKKFVREPNTNITLLINIGCAPPTSSSILATQTDFIFDPIRWTTRLDSTQRTNITGKELAGFSSWVFGSPSLFLGEGGKWKNAGAVGHMQTSDEGCQNAKLLGNM